MIHLALQNYIGKIGGYGIEQKDMIMTSTCSHQEHTYRDKENSLLQTDQHTTPSESDGYHSSSGEATGHVHVCSAEHHNL